MKKSTFELVVQRIPAEEEKLPNIKFASDAFRCNTCGLVTHLKIIGNSTKCVNGNCNGTMYRM